jgi:hypothetical protein
MRLQVVGDLLASAYWHLRPSRQLLMGDGYPLGNTCIGLEALWATTTEKWRQFGKCPCERGDPLGSVLASLQIFSLAT